MKKAMKLVWMVLFALPIISLTACGDDNDEPAPTVAIGDVTVSVDVNAQSATLTFPVTAMNFSADETVSVTYDVTGAPLPLTPNADGLYTVTLKNLTLGNTYDVKLEAKGAGVSDSKTVSVAMPLFKDYSGLLGKTWEQVPEYMNMAYDADLTDEESQGYVIGEGNVDYLYAYFVDLTQDNPTLLDNVFEVQVGLNEDLSALSIDKYLSTTYEYVSEDDGMFEYNGKNLLVYFMPKDGDEIVNWVMYFYTNSRSNTSDIRAAIKANMPQIRAKARAAKAAQAAKALNK